MSWFKRTRRNGDKKPRPEDSARTVRTEGLWQKCDNCREIIWKKDLEATRTFARSATSISASTPWRGCHAFLMKAASSNATSA